MVLPRLTALVTNSPQSAQSSASTRQVMSGDGRNLKRPSSWISPTSPEPFIVVVGVMVTWDDSIFDDSCFW